LLNRLPSFYKGTIKINQDLVRANKGLQLQEPKTRFSKRTIGINPTVIQVLKVLNNSKQSIAYQLVRHMRTIIWSFIMSWAHLSIQEL
jgi:hypothetical protein